MTNPIKEAINERIQPALRRKVQSVLDIPVKTYRLKDLDREAARHDRERAKGDSNEEWIYVQVWEKHRVWTVGDVVEDLKPVFQKGGERFTRGVLSLTGKMLTRFRGS